MLTTLRHNATVLRLAANQLREALEAMAYYAAAVQTTATPEEWNALPQAEKDRRARWALATGCDLIGVAGPDAEAMDRLMALNAAEAEWGAAKSVREMRGESPADAADGAYEDIWPSIEGLATTTEEPEK